MGARAIVVAIVGSCGGNKGGNEGFGCRSWRSKDDC